MTDIAVLLKPTEAAVVSGVDLSIVNHGIDRAWLPTRLIRKGKARGVSAEACVYIAFYHGSASRLTADERRFTISMIDRNVAATDKRSTWRLLASHCRVRHDFLDIDLAAFLKTTHERFDRYLAARNMVESDPDILGGTPVIKGTRVPVYDVAASVEASVPTARILEAYPALSGRQVELASLYAKANPPQGRPTRRAMRGGAAVLAERVVARRREA